MTADSGEIWCACRRTSTPSTPGILMSVTITSNSALSILRLANSPPVTVSTLWPSRRRAMSSSSQIERSSSQTRMLPTRSSCGCQRRSGGCRCGGGGGGSASGALLHAPQPHHETRALADCRARPHPALMRLDDLVHDGQAKPGSTLKVRLEGFEDFFRLLRVYAGTGVGEAHLPVQAAFGQGHGQRSASGRRLCLYCAHSVFAEVPEHLFELVAIGQHPGFGLREAALKLDARVLGGEAVFKQGESVLEQRNQIDALKAILLPPGIGQKVGDDVVEAIGFADHNLQKRPLFGIQRRRIRQHADRPRNGGKGISDFVSDGSGQAANGSEAILHAHLAFQAADLGKVVE